MDVDVRQPWRRWSGPVRDLVVGPRAWMPPTVVLALSAIAQAVGHGTDLAAWDMLLLSGWATLAAGLAVAAGLPLRMTDTVTRLRERGVLVGPADAARVHAGLDAVARRWALLASLVVAAGILDAFTAALSGNLAVAALLVALEMLGGCVAGFHLGRMAAYGQLGRVLGHLGVRVEARAGHVDGAAGLKPVGDFLFHQARVVGIPALFLAVWSLLIPVTGRYENWRDPYLGLLAVAVAFQVLAFVVPMWWFHQEMVRRKRELQLGADKLSREIDALRERMARGEVHDDDAKNLAAKAECYQAIEDMPTWPVDMGTRRRFTLRNAALLLPLAGHAVGDTALLKDVAKVLEGLQ